MRFLQVTPSEYIAIDTIAKIHDVTPIDDDTLWNSFSVTTKRGEVYSGLELSEYDFHKLVSGG